MNYKVGRFGAITSVSYDQKSSRGAGGGRDPTLQNVKHIKAKQTRPNHVLVSGMTMTSQIKLS